MTSVASTTSHVVSLFLKPKPRSNESPVVATSTAPRNALGFVSRWLYNYVIPLLQAAAHRPLTVDDSLPLLMNDRHTVQHSTESLQQIYSRLVHRNIEHDTKSSPSLLLTQALLKHQRRTLILTGLLRLVNTSVQAFPAILVARLLRLIEAGSEQPIYKSMSTAAILVGVLTIKMIIENQYFFHLVHASTSVRGSLAGMIFHKSLRLQQGGSSSIRMDTIGDTTAQLNANSTGMVKLLDTDPTQPLSSPTLGVGGVINLMQSDTSIIESAALQFHTVWDGPLQIAIYTTLLFRYLGSSVVWGMAALLMTIPVNSVALRILNRLSKYENEAKDARTKRTTESISNMKLLKLQGWEQQFADDIRFHRRKELQHFVTRGLIRATNSAISNTIPAVVLAVTLTAYVRTGRPIVASTIFTAISLFNQLRFPLFFYPLLIDSLANGRNAMRRIAAFLTTEEIVPYVQYMPLTENGGGSIEMMNGNFLWSQLPSVAGNPSASQNTAALVNVNVKVNPGEVVAVIGSVGSGKSALIQGLLGELSPVPTAFSDPTTSLNGATITGHPVVVSNGNIAYCSQEAWLPKGTIRDAITFGREYNEARYLAAIYDAGLDEDIIPMSLYDNAAVPITNGGSLSHNTDVGEGGSSLSGGQRARVSLARALYSSDDTKVFLLDDCLAALDTRVGSTVFERITRRLRRSKAATLLVTNDPSIPRRCDKVILMGSVPGTSSCSKVVDMGTYDELIARGHDLRGVSAYISDGNEVGSFEKHHILTADNIAANDTSFHAAPSTLSKIQTPIVVVGGSGQSFDNGDCRLADCETQYTMENCPDSIVDQVGMKRRSDDDDYQRGDYCLKDAVSNFNQTDSVRTEQVDVVAMSSTITPLTSKSAPVVSSVASADDSMSVGAVPRSVYSLYFKSVRSPLLVAAMLASFLLSNGAQFFQQYTVAKWTEVGANVMGSASGVAYLQRLVYAAGIVSVFLWIRSVLTMQVGVRASDFLHSKMLSSVFAAPMSFFDSTPSGQLLSRFGKEIETVDRAVPDSIGSVLFCFLQIFMSAGALAGILSSGMVIPLSMVAVLYVRMMSQFRPAARDMKREETKTRSPIYTNFGEAIRGAETIRSIRGATDYWSNRHHSLFETNLRVYFTVKALDRWLSTRLETLGNVVVFAAAVASVILTRSGQLKAGSAGWGLTQALAITGLLTWAVRTLTDLESNMMSVLRVKELTDLDSETVDLSKSTTKLAKMPKEFSQPGEALVPLLPGSTLNTTLAPLNSTALIQSGWPWRGSVEFRNVSMRYSPSKPLVLKDVSLSIPAGSTLGVVGRSGSGKSSLLLTLFRLVEIEGDWIGSIQIDGVDIRSVGIDALRQSLAIIPQDPVLFTGTLAYNLDATGKAAEADMMQALEIASPELAASFRQANGLATVISNSQLSVGERQLICLARALLRKSKILVLDEATSSVDSKTDQKVQETIRREFVDRGVTVITVAHRLDTVMAYDRIAVLGDGRLLEYGSPSELAAIPGGELQKLVLADHLNKRRGSKAKVSLKGSASLISS
jgi:ATP-binding cassette, subfamily C (CFTR/MRP), member 1